MQEALAQSIGVTAADALGRRSDERGGVAVSDEAIGAHLWFERGFRDHDTLVALINHTRRLLDKRPRAEVSPPRRPFQLSLDLGATL